jgi:hypothetical protein
MRVSSTQLNDYIACPRAWAFRYVGKEETIAGAAAAVGSIFHAIQEWRTRYGTFPTIEDIRALPGNYDSPGTLLARFGDEALYPLAAYMAEEVGDPTPFLPSDYVYPDLYLEFDLEADPIELTFDGVAEPVRLGGYLDILAFSEDGRHAWIGDWKTRGAASWKDRPVGADLASNAQLLYYAAALLYARPEIRTVTFTHLNVLRPNGVGGTVEVDVQTVRLVARDIEAWTAEVLLPTLRGMLAARAAWLDGDKAGVDTNRASCYRFGKCAHYTACGRVEAEATLLENIAANGGRFNPLSML